MLVITLICVYSAIVPRSWRILHPRNHELGAMTLALALVVVGCLITIARRLGRIANALK
jgi:hypothetical protein